METSNGKKKEVGALVVVPFERPHSQSLISSSPAGCLQHCLTAPDLTRGDRYGAWKNEPHAPAVAGRVSQDTYMDCLPRALRPRLDRGRFDVPTLRSYGLALFVAMTLLKPAGRGC